jgi:hypothetical protein
VGAALRAAAASDGGRCDAHRSGGAPNSGNPAWLQMASSVPVVQSHASSTTNQQQVQVDLTLQLGLGRRVAGDAGGGKKAAVAMDDGDRGGKDLDGLGLELRLCR